MEQLKRKSYESALEALQRELIEAQRWIMETGQRLLVVFEGRDAAGKGGVIKAMTQSLNTRGYRIIALPKPNECERTQWYFQRYVAHLPDAGEMVLFDRSWYNRAGVEHVMGFCSDTEYRRFLDDCPSFERLITSDGLILIKYWLACDQAEQEERFQERAEDPLKHWKISPIDIAARNKYVEYGKARDAIIACTNVSYAPWFVVNFNDQRRGRLNLIHHLLSWLPDRKLPTKSLELPPLKHSPDKEQLADPTLWVQEIF